jgi:hypothetical protein
MKAGDAGSDYDARAALRSDCGGWPKARMKARRIRSGSRNPVSCATRSIASPDDCTQRRPTNKRCLCGAPKTRSTPWQRLSRNQSPSLASTSARNSFHVAGLDECGAIVLQQKWSRGQGDDKREHDSMRGGFRAERLHASHSLSGRWLGHGVLSNRFATVRHTSPGTSETP